MTGEMGWIDPDGEAGDGNRYPVHALVAHWLGCDLRPFDTYIGPYVDHPKGKLWIGCTDDGVIGTVCLWPQGIAPAYMEPLVEEFYPPHCAVSALEAAQRLLERA